MKRVFVVAEGQTEEVFINTVLQPHLSSRSVWLIPIILTTRVTASGPNDKGGVASWGRVLRNIQNCCRDTSVAAVTTMLDYYALPRSAPGQPRGAGIGVTDHVEAIETAINEAVNDARFNAYLSVHEFEALTFASPDLCGEYLSDTRLRDAMRAALDKCGTPEAVNDDPQTAPSKRILAARPNYRKTSDGPTIAGLIGLDTLRSECPHFGHWLNWLESL